MKHYRKYIPLIVSILVFIISYSLFKETLSTQNTTTIHPDRKAIVASLSIASTTYPLSLVSGETVYDALNTVASRDASFVFKATLYPDLGYFIEEIQGIRNKHGTYWTLYVNDVYATQGASKTVIKDGDRISWKYQSL